MNEERQKRYKQNFQRLQIALLVGGVCVGLLLAVGLIALLNHWGLTDKPNQEREPEIQQPQEI